MKTMMILLAGAIASLGPAAALATGDEAGSRASRDGAANAQTRDRGASASGDPQAEDLEIQGERPDVTTFRRGRSIRVAERFTRPTLNNCTYTATVNGRIEEWLPPAERARESRGAQGGQRAGAQGNQGGAQASLAPAYVPDLSVDAFVQCPRTSARHATIGTLRGLPLTAQQLEQALEARGRVLNAAASRVCTYRPDFTVTGGRPDVVGVTQTCLHATGGGPSGGQSSGASFETR